MKNHVIARTKINLQDCFSGDSCVCRQICWGFGCAFANETDVICVWHFHAVGFWIRDSHTNDLQIKPVEPNAPGVSQTSFISVPRACERRPSSVCLMHHKRVSDGWRKGVTSPYHTGTDENLTLCVRSFS